MREWIPGFEKFVPDMRRTSVVPGTHIDPFGPDRDDVEYCQFMLTWRRGEEQLRKKWSRSISNPARVSRKLDLTMPAVVVVGDFHCQEVASLLMYDYVLSRIQ